MALHRHAGLGYVRQFWHVRALDGHSNCVLHLRRARGVLDLEARSELARGHRDLTRRDADVIDRDADLTITRSAHPNTRCALTEGGTDCPMRSVRSLRVAGRRWVQVAERRPTTYQTSPLAVQGSLHPLSGVNDWVVISRRAPSRPPNTRSASPDNPLQGLPALHIEHPNTS